MSSQYQSSYSPGFSSQSPHSVEQQELQQEPLQSGVSQVSSVFFKSLYFTKLKKLYCQLKKHFWFIISCWNVPLPRPRHSFFWRPPIHTPAALRTGRRFRPPGSVLLQQPSCATCWPQECQGGYEWLSRPIKWLQRSVLSSLSMCQ